MKRLDRPLWDEEKLVKLKFTIRYLLPMGFLLSITFISASVSTLASTVDEEFTASNSFKFAKIVIGSIIILIGTALAYVVLVF